MTPCYLGHLFKVPISRYGPILGWGVRAPTQESGVTAHPVTLPEEARDCATGASLIHLFQSHRPRALCGQGGGGRSDGQEDPFPQGASRGGSRGGRCGRGRETNRKGTVRHRPRALSSLTSTSGCESSKPCFQKLTASRHGHRRVPQCLEPGPDSLLTPTPGPSPHSTLGS